ncbi:MAG: tRNA (N(6)-L-threonylcarbamoyladenosine(37)-C(2))-methylthiotransferase MtaB [Clostridiales bacterium]|nr:tRNA (N(6)-L-threonylcarbamoyladenosine(37)-C(2))-methylthiotransferase MtaB [Clostridiales bacterium]
MKAAFCTLGCKVNQYDTEAMRELFENAGYETVDFSEPADVYVVNTCTVTATGDKKSRQMISRAHALAPDAKIIVAGCYAQRAPEEVIAMPGVCLVIGAKDRLRVVELTEALGNEKKTAVGDLKWERIFEPLTVSREGRTRAHLKIQEGCDRFCTYCIIPYARGPIRSRPLAEVKAELKKLADAGYKEVVLTGIHLMSYGRDLDGSITLIDAISKADDIDGIERIRLGSLEPQMLTDDFVSTLASNRKVCRQFHLSLQSGSKTVLERMRRRYTPDEYAECVKRLRAKMPECAVTTDIIVGFPGETEREFEETLQFARDVALARIHVFPYSRREGTKAAAMPGQLSRGVKAVRAAKLGSLAKALEQEYASVFVGTVQDVLLEEREGECFSGHTDTYLKVLIPAGEEDLSNRFMRVRIEKAAEGVLYGMPAAEQK